MEPPIRTLGPRPVRETPRPDAESRRSLRLLRDLIEDADLTIREVERRAGLNRGYLEQLLAGRIELKLWHLFAVLEVLGHTPNRFFSALYPRRPPVRARPTVDLRVTKEDVQVYRLAVESVTELRGRLERCERELTELVRSGVVDELLP